MPKIAAAPPISKGFWKKPIIPPLQIKKDFLRLDKVVALERKTIRNLSWLSREQYEGVLRLVKRLNSPDQKFVRLLIDPPQKINKITSLPDEYFKKEGEGESVFDYLSVDFLMAQIDKKTMTLDLRNLQGRINQWIAQERGKSIPVETNGPKDAELFQGVLVWPPPDEQVGRMMDVIAEERKIFQRLARDSDATVDKIFRAIDHGKKKLGIMNVAVYRPLADGNWARTQRTRHWTHELSKYDLANGGSPAETTLKSVIEGDKTIYDVNITDLNTFRSEGIVPDRESIENDLIYSKGPGRILFIKVVSSYGIEAVVQLHNRVRNNEKINPPPLLPVNPKDAARVKTELELYFAEAGRALETIRRKETTEEAIDLAQNGVRISTQKPLSDYQYHGSSAMEGFVGLSIETNTNPSLNFARLEGYIIEADTRVVEDCIGERPDYDEMREHAILVNIYKGVRDGKKKVAFATSRYFDNYKNRNGKKERVTLLWGTMVKRSYRRLGLMVKLNYDLINAARQAAQEQIKGIFKSIRRLWIKAPLLIRTQSRAVWEASHRYFKGVRRIGESNAERHQRMIDFLAGEYGWDLDQKNIQRNAYPAPRVDKEEDLIPGLGFRDAYVFAGDFTLLKRIKMWLDVKILYPLRARRKANGGEK